MYSMSSNIDVFHTDRNGTSTFIATAQDAEKAHFLTTAANAYYRFDKIVAWADARNLIAGSNPQAQTVKLFEEGGELAGGVARGKVDVVKDSIGDMIVVLTILAEQFGLSIADCIDAAYDEIKDRKGRMVDGVFIKEE